MGSTEHHHRLLSTQTVDCSSTPTVKNMAILSNPLVSITSRAGGIASASVRGLQLSGRRSLSLSSVEGPSEPPLERRTLYVYFRDEILRKHAERPALVCRQERPRVHGGPLSRNMGVSTHLTWDFQEFDRHISAVARGLISLGVKKGDRVAVIMGNNRCGLMLLLSRALPEFRYLWYW